MSDFKIGDEVVFLGNGKKYLVIEINPDSIGCRTSVALLVTDPVNLTKTGRHYDRIQDWDEYEPPWIHRRATINVDLYYNTIESDESVKAAIEQELNCCHCVNEILDIELG